MSGVNRRLMGMCAACFASALRSLSMAGAGLRTIKIYSVPARFTPAAHLCHTMSGWNSQPT